MDEVGESEGFKEYPNFAHGLLAQQVFQYVESEKQIIAKEWI